MKCTNKLLCAMMIPVLTATLFAAGCGSQRTDLDQAYDVYNTTASYGMSGSSAGTGSDAGLNMLATNLCVGGVENADTSAVDSDLAGSAGVFTTVDEEITFSQNIYEKRYPASTTKILTTLVALKYGNLEDEVTVDGSLLEDLDSASSVCGIEDGDVLTLEQLLYGLMLMSGNDAAVIIADHVAGSTEEFADLMNQEAESLGATHSHFVNANGLPDDDHYTCVYDLYLIFNAAIQNEQFKEIISTKDYPTTYKNKDGETVDMDWANTNYYLSGDAELPDGFTAIGGKTGHASSAGYNLVFYSENPDGQPIISVVMQASEKMDMYTYTTELLEAYAQ